jgi:PKD repeat protein
MSCRRKERTRTRRRTNLVALLGCSLFLLGAAPATAAPAWLAPLDLSLAGRDAIDPAVAMDDAGGTVAVWEREGATPFTRAVQASTRSPGDAFSAPVDLSVPAQDPQVAMTPGGQAVVAWWHFENPPGAYVLQTSTHTAGGGFSIPEDVKQLASGMTASAIQLVVNAAGDAALAWTSRAQPEPTVEEEEAEEEPDPVTVVEVSVRPAGGSFSTPETVSPVVAEKNAGGPEIAIDGSGGVMAIWRFGNAEAGFAVEAAHRPAEGEFAPEALFEEGENADSPDVAMDSAGNAILVWVHPQGEDRIVAASTRPPNGEFSTPPVDLSPTGAEAFTPEIAMTPSGEATVIWTLIGGASDQSVQAAARPPGGEFTSPQDLSVALEEPLAPALALSTANHAVVTWSGLSGANHAVRAVTRSGGGGFSAPAELSATGPFFFPDPTVDRSGDATVVWSGEKGADKIVQAAGYDAGAPEIRGISIPASGTVGVPVQFSVDPFDVWPIASTNFSFGDGEFADGASVSHAYSAPGTYQVTATATDPAGSSVSAGGTISIAASNDFSIGKLKRNKRSGRATLFVQVTGPGKLALFGRGAKKVRRVGKRPGVVKMPVTPTRRSLKLLRRGKNVKVRTTVVFDPTGGSPARRHRVVVLVMKARHRAHHRH